MSKHEAVNTHTFTTEEGIKIVAEVADYRLRALNIQFPGSGNRPVKIIPAEIRELAGIAGDATRFLEKQGLMPGGAYSSAEPEETPQLG